MILNLYSFLISSCGVIRGEIIDFLVGNGLAGSLGWPARLWNTLLIVILNLLNSLFKGTIIIIY